MDAALISISLVLFGLVLDVLVCRRARLVARLVAAAPTPVAAARAGAVVKVRGVVVPAPGAVRQAPVSGRAAVYWSVNLGNPDVGDDRQRGFDRHTRVFGLDDGSGVTARVVVEGAQQLLPADYATVSAEVWPGPEHRVLGRLTPELLAWAAARCPGATDVRFLEETRIEPGSTLVAIGVVARDASGVRVEGNPLLLLGAEEALCSRTARRAQWLGLGIAASGVALGAIRAGLAALGVP